MLNRLFGHKRIELQLEAFRKLPDQRLVIVGSYEQSRHFRSHAEYIKRIYISPVPLFLEILVTISFFILVLFNLHSLLLFFGIYSAVAGITFLYIFWLNDFLANLNKYSFFLNI